MDLKYPHWYQDGYMEPCCDDYMVNNMCCEETPYKMFEFHRESLKDRILCLLGCEVLFSVDARICRRESFCGTLCYVGCDFIIVNVNIRHRCLSMHIPIKALRFIAPLK
jgi:hypothetical protein